MRQSQLHMNNQQNKHEEDGYSLLAMAIVRKACEDYIMLRRTNRTRMKVECGLYINSCSIRKFFYGCSYEIFSNVNPTYLLSVLDNADIEYIKRYYTSREKRGLL
jgi:hypothetical protein